jgi:hypothetical protein
MNTTKRKMLALLAVPLLALPSAIGVFYWLSPHSGPIGAILAATGFEVLYIGINVLIISSPELRKYARNVALAAVATAVIFNTLARYQAMLCPPPPEGVEAIVCSIRTAPDDYFALFLAVLEAIPLAGLAYAVSVLLHRLSEVETAGRGELERLRVTLGTIETELQAAREEAATQGDELVRRQQLVAERDQTIADLRTLLADQVAEAASWRDTAASKDEASADLREELMHAREQLARIEPTAASAERSLEEAREQLRTAREEAARHAHEAAALRERPAPLPPTLAQVVGYARDRMVTGATLSEVARELGWPESTLRGWLKTSANGHAVEV